MMRWVLVVSMMLASCGGPIICRYTQDGPSDACIMDAMSWFADRRGWRPDDLQLLTVNLLSSDIDGADGYYQSGEIFVDVTTNYKWEVLFHEMMHHMMYMHHGDVDPDHVRSGWDGLSDAASYWEDSGCKWKEAPQ